MRPALRRATGCWCGTPRAVRPGVAGAGPVRRRHGRGQAGRERRTTRDGAPAWWLLSDNPADGRRLAAPRGRCREDRRARRSVLAAAVAARRRRRSRRRCGPGRRPVAADGWPPMTEIEPAHPFAGDPVFDLHVGGKMEIRSTVALNGRDELSLAYTPGVARVCEAIAADPVADPALHLGAQHRRGRHRRHRGARARRHRPGRGDAGDGGQGGAVQAVRRRRRDPDLPGHHRRRGDHRDRRAAGAELRRHQPRGHLRAALLRDRGPAQGDGSTSRSSTTTSTAPPSWRSPRSRTRCG